MSEFQRKNDQLPADLLKFLDEGGQLDYDIESSAVKRIRLKSKKELSLSTINTFPGSDLIVDDPYYQVDGVYEIGVYDLVAESEIYLTEGLFCWITALKRFGSIDPEHGDVITFPDVNWTDIVSDPQPYLDAQWNEDDFGVRVLPWLHFPLKVSETDTVILPYRTNCPIHGAPLTRQVSSIERPPLFDIVQRREMDSWLQHYVNAFPCSGVPVSEVELLYCSSCRAAENEWLVQAARTSAAVDAKRDPDGWVRCPNCNKRFSTSDKNAFLEGFHLMCAQKVNIVGED